MKLGVQYSGQMLEVNMNDSSQIKDVKAELKRLYGIPFDDQCLFTEPKAPYLNDSVLVKSLNMRWINLELLNLRDQIQFKISHPDGLIFDYSFKRIQTVSYVKFHLSKVLCVPARGLLLYIGSKFLQDSDTLFQCEVSEETRIDCLISHRSLMP